MNLVIEKDYGMRKRLTVHFGWASCLVLLLDMAPAISANEVTIISDPAPQDGTRH
jgi:hypothetical protein